MNQTDTEVTGLPNICKVCRTRVRKGHPVLLRQVQRKEARDRPHLQLLTPVCEACIERAHEAQEAELLARGVLRFRRHLHRRLHRRVEYFREWRNPGPIQCLVHHGLPGRDFHFIHGPHHIHQDLFEPVRGRPAGRQGQGEGTDGSRIHRLLGYPSEEPDVPLKK